MLEILLKVVFQPSLSHKMRKSSRFRMHMARNGISDFDGYVQKYSPLLRNMKTARVENLLAEELYNIGDEDTARHWLTPLTGIIYRISYDEKCFSVNIFFQLAFIHII